MITTKGRYALRVMIDLAEHEGDGYIPLKEIAARQGISEKYLESILKALVRNKLLKGLRGKGGGYMLTRSIDAYPIGEILELAEGSMASVVCLSEGADPCEKAPSCKTLPMWQKFDALVHDFFYNITLADLISETEQNFVSPSDSPSPNEESA